MNLAEIVAESIGMIAIDSVEDSNKTAFECPMNVISFFCGVPGVIKRLTDERGLSFEGEEADALNVEFNDASKLRITAPWSTLGSCFLVS